MLKTYTKKEGSLSLTKPFIPSTKGKLTNSQSSQLKKYMDSESIPQKIYESLPNVGKLFGKSAADIPKDSKLQKQKNGGTVKAKDGKWMQKVSASIKKRGTAGKCTPITKPGCTGKAKVLAKTFKKIAKSNKKK